MKSVLGLLSLLAVGAMLLVLTGCATVPSEGQGSDLPWNEPAGWERSGFGIPM